MDGHVLDDDEKERAYFKRQNKNGAAAYRRAVMRLTGGLPYWAVGERTKQPNYTRAGAFEKHFQRPETQTLFNKLVALGTVTTHTEEVATLPEVTTLPVPRTAANCPPGTDPLAWIA